MTLETVLAWSTGRSLILTSLALLLAIPIHRAIAGEASATTKQKLLITAALLPLFVPDLLIGFAYRLTSARLLRSVAATEALYAVLLLVRVIALQVAVQLMLPCSAVSDEALHTWKLNPRRDNNWRRTWLRLQVAGPARAPLVAWLGGALLCFQEFETAALLQIDRHPIAWTVWLFDAHAAGEPLSSSLSFAAPALVVQCVWLLPCLWLLLSGPAQATGLSGGEQWSNSSRFVKLATGITIIAGLLLVIFWPIVSNAAELFRGISSLANQQALWSRSKQILASLTECAIAAYMALQVCRFADFLKSRALKILLVLPGLCGSLVLSLSLLAAFQLPVLHGLYDTWVPMVLGHVLLLLPRAILLVTVLDFLTSASTQHSGDLLFSARHESTIETARKLSWTMHKRKWLLALAILTHWCFWDVTIAATLRPVTFEPIITRLYNEMHYGRTETLVAITGLALLIPLTIFVAAGFAWRRVKI